MLKFLKVISFSRNITFILNTFNKCFTSLANFLLVFMVILIGFISLICVVFNDKSNSTQSFISTLETSLLIVLGKFNTNAFTQSSPVMVPLIFVAFNVVIVMTLANLMITIITGYFSQAKLEYSQLHGAGDSILLEYAKAKLYQYLRDFNRIRQKKLKAGNFMDDMTLLKEKANQVIHIVNSHEKVEDSLRERQQTLSKLFSTIDN
jgi:hypothetical protein